MSIRSARFVSLAIACFAMASVAHAQSGPQSGALTVRAASGESTRIDAGGVSTSAFTVKNTSADTIHATPLLAVPRGWTVVMGTAPVAIAPGTMDTWLVGIAIPASAPANNYVVRASLATAHDTTTDSIFVRVNERRVLEVLPMDVPGWVLAGARYESRFLVRNRGNVSSTVVLLGATGRGTHAEALPAGVTLAPGASTMVTVRVAIGTAFDRTTDDVLELTATDKGDNTVRATASTRTTIVSTEAISRFATVPATLALRSIGAASGVSPVALSGGGLLPDNKTAVDFLLQAPTGRQSPYGFGERDEYRANFTSDRFSLKLGDNVYGFSPLTSSGMIGTGAAFQETNGTLTAGAYAQHLRWFPGSNFEEGVILGTAPDSARGLNSTFVERQSNGNAVTVGSVGGHIRLFQGATLHVETASSDSDHTNGFAERARIGGTIHNVTYDIGVLNGAATFAGQARGTTVEDGAVTARLGGQFTIGASGSARVSDIATPFSGLPAQHFSSATINASYGGLATLEYGWLSRRDDGALTELDGTQRGLRASTSFAVGAASFSLSAEHGVIDATLDASSRPYNVVTISAQTKLWNAGSISVFGTHDDGTTLTGGTSGVASAGVNLDFHLPFGFELALGTSAQRATLGVFDGSGAWFSQSDARLDYHFSGGQALSLRERIWQNPSVVGMADASATYLEFRMPLKLPVGLSHSVGRAEGIIVDANTGKPVVGALVRIADQAAVTDKNGRVSFGGLEPEKHLVSIDATGAVAGALLVGDAFVNVESKSTTPAKFSLAVARGGSVRALVRRLDRVNGTLDKGADSLVTVAMEPNVLVALESGRDTIYQSSDDRGRLDFGSVAPGKWTLVVMPGDLPERHVFESDRIELNVQPGARNDVELRLIPQRRAVTFIGHDEPVIKSTPKP
jgi:hypothetical protein